MSSITSSQILSNLEKSQQPAITLLDDAFRVLGVEAASSVSEIDNVSATSQSDTGSFRGKWVLRWLIKCLIQEIDASRTKDNHLELLEDERTWFLLRYLLLSIPNKITRDILVERHFAELLGNCLERWSKFRHDTSGPSSISDSAESDEFVTERPAKKRKLSGDTVALSARVLRCHTAILDTTSHILGIKHRAGSTKQGSIRWASSTEVANIVLGQVLAYTSRAMKSPSLEFKAASVDLLRPVEQWLELWESFKPAKAPKQNSAVLFNEYLLEHVLAFLQYRSVLPKDTVFRLLERLVATNTILPAREAFQHALKKYKTTGVRQLSDEQTTSVMKNIVKPFGRGILAMIGDTGTGTHLLLSIAGRTVPRTDVMRRRAEASWFEALHYTLHILASAYANGVDSSVHTELQSVYEKVFDHGESRRAGDVVRPLLEIFAKLTIEPSSAFWNQYLQERLSSGSATLSDLSTIVNLNRSIFVTSPTESSNEFMQLLVNRARHLSESDRGIFITQIVIPILEAYGKARQLPAFIEYWLHCLTGDIEDQVRKFDSRHTELSDSFLWDDARLLKAFQSALYLYGPLSISDTLLENLAAILAMEAQISPATYSRIIIASSIINALERSAQGKDISSRYAPDIFDSALTLLKMKKHDEIDSQKWRLWKFVDILSSLESMHDKIGSLEMDELPWPNLDTIVKRDTNEWRRMNYLYAFCASTTFYEKAEERSRILFESQISSLFNMFRKPPNAIKAQDDTTASTYFETGWNGTVPDMSSSWKLLSACILRTTTVLVFNTPSSLTQKQTLYGLMEMASLRTNHGNEVCDSDMSLGTAAEAVLVAIERQQRVNMLDVYIEFLKMVTESSTRRMLIQRIPGLVQHLIDGKINKQQAQDLQKALFNILGLSVLSDQGYVDCLNVIHNLLSYCNVISDSWIRFLDSLERAGSNFSLLQFVAAGEFLSKICTVHTTRAIAQAQVENTTSLLETLAWANKKFDKIAASKRSIISHNYFVNAILAIIEQAHLSGLAENANFDQEIKEQSSTLLVHFQEHSLKVAKKCVEDSSNAVSCFVSWRILQVVQILDKSMSSSTKLLELMETVRKGIDSVASSNGSLNTANFLTSGSIDHMASVTTRADMSQASRAFISSLGNLEGLTQPDKMMNEQTSVEVADTSTYDSLVRALTHLPASNQLSIRASEARTCMTLANFIINLSTEDLAVSPEIVRGLGRFASLEDATFDESAHSLVLRLEVCKIVLEQHSGTVNQHIIDTILRMLAILSSSTSKAHVLDDQDNLQPNHIFDRLCNVLSILLIRYRRRISGRYHLLLPALQNLLKCLFYPHSRNALNATPATYPSKAAFLESLPYWLNPRDRTSFTTLPPSSAARFSRILQTLCDPSASSARRTVKRKQNGQDKQSQSLGLVDEAKVLRQQVSQHTQYLLQTYCQVTLDGLIAPEVRGKLIPGMYAVISATDIEILRTVNAGMNESQTAIWKDLYGEWRRGGKWNHR